MKKQLAWRLEPEGKSETNNAVAQSIADHAIAYAGISKADERRLLTLGEPNVFNVGIDALEVGMIEHVLERGVEFQDGAFIHLDVLEQPKIGNVSDRIL